MGFKSRFIANMLATSKGLSDDLDPLTFTSPVTHVYNPLAYAWKMNETFITRYCQEKPKAVLLGMNPGPFGMAQTGIPFGDIDTVKNWLQIKEEIRPPDNLHPKRPILGLDCQRVEVSGSRLWGWAKDVRETPHEFFKDFFVVNFCPLVFMSETGKNITPDKLALKERKIVFEICDHYLQKTVALLAPKRLIGIGNFAETRLKKCFADHSNIGKILHPSPASPAANRGWQGQVKSQLANQGIY